MICRTIRRVFFFGPLIFVSAQLVWAETEIIDAKKTYERGGILYFKGGFDKVSGHVINRNPDGSIERQGLHLNGKRHGFWERFFSNGNVHTRASYDEGKLIDLTSYSYNGRIQKEEKYLEGKPFGLWKWYYANGQLRQQGRYIGEHLGDAIPDGTWEWFYANGQMWMRTTYIDGKEDGLRETYGEDGSVEIGVWQNGEYLGTSQEIELYNKIYEVCIDKENAGETTNIPEKILQKCEDTATNPSWLEKIIYQ